MDLVSQKIPSDSSAAAGRKGDSNYLAGKRIQASLRGLAPTVSIAEQVDPKALEQLTATPLVPQEHIAEVLDTATRISACCNNAVPTTVDVVQSEGQITAGGDLLSKKTS